MHNGEPYVIELAARLSGGFFCTREIPLNTGVDFIGCAIKVALGEPVAADELEPQAVRAGDPALCLSQTRARGLDRGRRRSPRTIAGVAEVVVTARPGDVIPPAGDKRPSAAMVLATGASRESALAAANDALSRLRIETA